MRERLGGGGSSWEKSGAKPPLTLSAKGDNFPLHQAHDTRAGEARTRSFEPRFSSSHEDFVSVHSYPRGRVRIWSASMTCVSADHGAALRRHGSQRSASHTTVDRTLLLRLQRMKALP